MRKNEIQIGAKYIVKVSGNLVPVKIIAESPYGGWVGRNTITGREVRVKTAGRCRRPVSPAEGSPESSRRNQEMAGHCLWTGNIEREYENHSDADGGL